MSGRVRIQHRATLTTAERSMLQEAIDSHVYWQLADRQYRDNGSIRTPGSDDPDTRRQIAAFRRLGEKLLGIDTDAARCPECGGVLEVVTDGAVSRTWFSATTYQLETRIEDRPFMACTGCEFCQWMPEEK